MEITQQTEGMHKNFTDADYQENSHAFRFQAYRVLPSKILRATYKVRVFSSH